MPTPKWTFIVFINSENDLLPHAIDAYNELALTGSNKNMNLIAFVDFPTFHIYDDIESLKYGFLEEKKRWGPSLYFVEKNVFLKDAESFVTANPYKGREDNLYNTKNIIKFIKAALTKYPAEHYGFAYKSHGGQTTDIEQKFVEYLLVKLREDEFEIVPSNQHENSGHLKFLTHGLVELLPGRKHLVNIRTQSSFNLKDTNLKYQLPYRKNKLKTADEGVEVTVSINEEKLIERLRKNGRYQERFWQLDLENALIPDDKKPDEVIVGFVGQGTKVLSFKKFAEAIKLGFQEKVIDIILMDCCWGMSIDMAELFSTKCTYYVASADESPARGIGYDILFKTLAERPGEWLRPEELARMIPATFYSKRYDDYLNFDDISDETFLHYGVSFTSINCNAVKGCIGIFEKLCRQLLQSLDDNARHSQTIGLIKKSRNKCDDFTYQASTDEDHYRMYNIDLIWFLENLIYYIDKEYATLNSLKEICYKLIVCIRLYIIEGFVGNNYTKTNLSLEKKQRECKGVSITFPEDRAQYDVSIYAFDKFVGFDFAKITGWSEVLQKYYAVND